MWFGVFDRDKLEIVGTLAVYQFPRSDTCKPLYCNIEGVAWFDSLRIVATSDKAKKDQPWSCTIKDQSIHQFMLPRPLPESVQQRATRAPPSNMKCPQLQPSDWQSLRISI